MFSVVLSNYLIGMSFTHILCIQGVAENMAMTKTATSYKWLFSITLQNICRLFAEKMWEIAVFLVVGFAAAPFTFAFFLPTDWMFALPTQTLDCQFEQNQPVRFEHASA